MSAVVKKCTVSELEACESFPALLDEYANECAIVGLPHPCAKMEMYHIIEKEISLLGAFVEDVLVGFICVLAPVLPHYGVTVSVAESYFVAKAHRKSGAGTLLRQEAERIAKASNSEGILISAPYGGDLEAVLPHVGYRETNRVFFKRLNDV